MEPPFPKGQGEHSFLCEGGGYELDEVPLVVFDIDWCEPDAEKVVLDDWVDDIGEPCINVCELDE